jgi:hypothetical protein
VSEVSAMKESLSNSFSRMSTRQKRRNKKLRRQTGTIDISYATDYYPEPVVSSSRLSGVSVKTHFVITIVAGARCA